MNSWPGLVNAAVLLSLAYLAVVALAAIVLALRAGARRDDVAEQAARSSSRFTIPVSLILPIESATQLTPMLDACARLSYPEFEVIAVCSGANDDGFAAAAAAWQLEAREFFYRQTIATGGVRRIYRSGCDGRVMVVDKVPGQRADAINCGVNIARFRYVAVIDPDIVFDAGALSRLMSVPLRDPGTVLAATAHVERPGVERLGGLRSLMVSRLFWRHRSRALAGAGLVYAWRRDAVIDARGYSTSAFDPEADLVRRAVLAASAQGAPARVHRSAEIFGTGAARPLTRVLAGSGRQGLSAWTLLALLAPEGLAAFGLKTVSWQIATSLLTPLAELTVAGGCLHAAVTGGMSWSTAAAALIALAFGRAAVTTAAILLRGVSAGAPDERALSGLLAAAPFELAMRPLQAAGTVLALAGPRR